MLARIAAVLVTSVPALAQSPQWGLAATYPLASEYEMITAGDVNGDGRTDLVVPASSFPGNPNGVVMLGQANGGFSFVPLPNMRSDYQVALGQFDGDGIPDLMNGTLFHGNGDGTFTVAVPQPFGFGGTPGSAGYASADLNGDGFADLVGTGFRVAFANPLGGFLIPNIYSGCGGVLTIADMDADGRLDVVANSGGLLGILWNTPPTFFTQCWGGGTSHAAVGDYTGDGLADCVIDGRLLTAQLSGGFTAGLVISPLIPGWSEAFDCDGDGQIDFAAFGSASRIVVARAVGSGVFDTTCQLTLPVPPTGNLKLLAVISANVMSDPRPELVLLASGFFSSPDSKVFVLQNLSQDCNHNGIDDPVEIANALTTDCDSNGIPDSCQTDCDNSGTPDVCQITAQPSLDLNVNGAIDSCEPLGTQYCFGDGTGAACPCDPGQAGPTGGGCLNSNNGGGRLRAYGNAQVALDSVTMTTSGIGASAIAMLFQGTSPQAAGQGSPFGDGLLCVNGTIIRLVIRSATAGSVSYGWGASDPALSMIGLVPGTGGTRFYQTWYRDSAAFCTGFTYNLTNGVEVAWQP